MKFDFIMGIVFFLIPILFLISFVSTFDKTEKEVVCIIEDAYMNESFFGSDYRVVVSVHGGKCFIVSGMDEYYFFKDLVGEEVNATLCITRIGGFTLEKVNLLKRSDLKNGL